MSYRRRLFQLKVGIRVIFHVDVGWILVISYFPVGKSTMKTKKQKRIHSFQGKIGRGKALSDKKTAQSWSIGFSV